LRRLLLGALIFSLAYYVAGFALNEYLSHRRGPWEVTFQAASTGHTTLLIRQPSLGIEEARLEFPEEPYTNNPTTIRFDAPRTPIPLGEVRYDDLTYLPGVVTLELFGHEIELLPRTLYLNRKPIAWPDATNLVLLRQQRPPPPDTP